jgi:hypothetical protein
VRCMLGLVGLCLAIIAFAPLASAEERWSAAVEEEALRNEAVGRVLAPVVSAVSLSDVTTYPPSDCTEIPGHGKWCTWSLGRTSPGWSSLVEALGFGAKRVSLVVSYDPEAADSVKFKGAWSTNSRFSPWYLAPKQSKRKGVGGRRELKQLRASRQAAAKPVFEAIASLEEAVAIAGRGPQACSSTPGGFQCAWHLKRTAWGHALASAVLADDSQIEMICAFRADGSAEARPACTLARP